MRHISSPSAWSPAPARLVSPAVESPATVLLAVSDPDASPYLLYAFTRIVARSPAEISTLLQRERPTVAVIDLDVPDLDGSAVCAAAGASDTSVLVVMTSPEKAPEVLKAGCHAVLLKPFAPNLLSARLGRLLRGREQARRLRQGRSTLRREESGTNRVWEEVVCPGCNAPNATSFEFSSHRRMWFACLGCGQVWIGARQE